MCLRDPGKFCEFWDKNRNECKLKEYFKHIQSLEKEKKKKYYSDFETTYTIDTSKE